MLMPGLLFSLSGLAAAVDAETSLRPFRLGTFNIKYDRNPPSSDFVGNEGDISSFSSSSFSSCSAPAYPTGNTVTRRTTDSIRLKGRTARIDGALNHKGHARHVLRRQSQAGGEQPWSDRREPLASQILFEELDVFGLQEVLHNQLEDLRMLLGSEYECVGVGRDDGDTKGEAVRPSLAACLRTPTKESHFAENRPGAYLFPPKHVQHARSAILLALRHAGRAGLHYLGQRRSAHFSLTAKQGYNKCIWLTLKHLLSGFCQNGHHDETSAPQHQPIFSRGLHPFGRPR